MSDRAKTYFHSCAFWGLMLGILGTMARGTWVASEVHKDVQDLKVWAIKRDAAIDKILENDRTQDKDISRIKEKLGISKITGHSNTVFTAYELRDL